MKDESAWEGDWKINFGCWAHEGTGGAGERGGK